MGKPKFSRKKFETPSHPWQESRIKEENELIQKYGLKNKREVWKAHTKLRNYRGQARSLLAKIVAEDPQAKKESQQLLLHLTRYNILPPNSTLDDVLALEDESILSRRLQTLVYLKGFASTPKQARQLISHGHISIDDSRVTVPGYLVTKNEESNISYIQSSPLNDAMHPARPKTDYKSKIPIRKDDTDKKPVVDKVKPETTKKEVTKDEKKPSVEKTDDKKQEQKSEGKPKEEKEHVKTGEVKKEQTQEKPKDEDNPKLEKTDEKKQDRPKEEPKKKEETVENKEEVKTDESKKEQKQEENKKEEKNDEKKEGN